MASVESQVGRPRVHAVLPSNPVVQDATGSVSRLPTALLLIPLALAPADLRLAAFASVVCFLILLLSRGRGYSPKSLDFLVLTLIGLVLVSPTWSFLPELSGDASRGVAAALLMTLSVRMAVRTYGELAILMNGVSAVTLALGAYFLVYGVELDVTYGFETAGTRATLEFANSNYIGAILVFGIMSSAVTMTVSRSKGSRALVGLAIVTGVIALQGTGSRASLAGLLLATSALLVLRRSSRALRLTGWIALAGSLLLVLPGGLLRWTAAFIQALPSSNYDRPVEALLDNSGREIIWHSAWNLIERQPILGWGLESYRFAGEVPVLAHSWSLEVLASLGLVGFALVATIVLVAFHGGLPRRSGKTGLNEARYSTATLLALAPTLMLSTHQWTIWLWFAIGTWSVANVLDEDSSTAMPTD